MWRALKHGAGKCTCRHPITPPPHLDGSTTNDNTTVITGSFNAPPNSAVTINGQLATLNVNGQFFVNDVPLALGQNIMTITLTTQDDQTTTQTLTITRTQARCLC